MFYSKHIIIAAHNIFLIFWGIFWCLMPLSATLQLYSGGGSRGMKDLILVTLQDTCKTIFKGFK
jgi:hypothetical protein